MEHKRNIAALKAKLYGRWDQALAYVYPGIADALVKPGSNVDSPIDNDHLGFRVFKDVSETGGGVVQNMGKEGVFADGISLLMCLTGHSFVEVFDELAEWVDGRADDRPSDLYNRTQEARKEKEDDTHLRAYLNRTWEEAIPLESIDDSPAHSYLAGRGILEAADKAACFRIHPSMPYNHKGEVLGHYPVLLAGIRDNSGLPVGLHRIYLSEAGEKLELEGKLPTKMSTPSINAAGKGRVIPMGARAMKVALAHGVVGVCEGIETALSVYEATGIPMMSTISASNLGSFVPPEGIHTVLVFADDDRSKAGIINARMLKDRLDEKGIECVVLLPELDRPPKSKSVDWADQWIIDPTAFDQVLEIFFKFSTAKMVDTDEEELCEPLPTERSA